MTDRALRTSVRLDEDLHERIQQARERGYAVNVSALTRDAAEAELNRIERMENTLASVKAEKAARRRRRA